MRVMMALLALAISLWQTDAAAQALPPPIDLNGVWELTEYGARLSDKPAIVRIGHAGDTVSGTFIRASECRNGTPRTAAFLGGITVIQPTTPPIGEMTFPSMWVCSNDPDLVERCGLNAVYKTKSTRATAEADYIEGSRVTQGMAGCWTDSSRNGTEQFSLRRLTPCEWEQRILDDAEEDLVAALQNMIARKQIFQDAIDAAKQRFGEKYRTGVFEYPHAMVDLDGDATDAVALFSMMPAVFESRGWLDARGLAGELAIIEEPPLLEARRMLEEMNRIEQLGPGAQRALTAFENARASLSRCLEQR